MPRRIVDDPATGWIVALRRRMNLSQQKFANRFGLDARAIQDWEQGRRVPDRAARVLLTVIESGPEVVAPALATAGELMRSSGEAHAPPSVPIRLTFWQ